MKRLIFVFLFINFHTVAFNQIITGTVLDKKTKEAIPLASVYFNGTKAGTTADKNGVFKFDISKNKSMPITISAIGYYSKKKSDYSISEPLEVYLSPKIYELEETVVSDKSLKKKRKRYMRLFKDEFLGTTVNSHDCVILNEGDISFDYGSADDTLRTYALKPIIIANKALGYKITYYLDKFEYYKKNKSTFFRGNIIFKEMVKSPEMFLEKRVSTYRGSRMHFIRSLWKNDLGSNGFRVSKPGHDKVKYNPIKYAEVVLQDGEKNKFIRSLKPLEIDYKANLSCMVFLKEYVYFDKTGYFDPSGINWEGEMGKQRIADWLPYEFSLE